MDIVFDVTPRDNGIKLHNFVDQFLFLKREIILITIVRLDRGSSSDITKLSWACIAASCDAACERSPSTDQFPSKPRKGKKLVSAWAAKKIGHVKTYSVMFIMLNYQVL